MINPCLANTQMGSTTVSLAVSFVIGHTPSQNSKTRFLLESFSQIQMFWVKVMKIYF